MHILIAFLLPLVNCQNITLVEHTSQTPISYFGIGIALGIFLFCICLCAIRRFCNCKRSEIEESNPTNHSCLG